MAGRADRDAFGDAVADRLAGSSQRPRLGGASALVAAVGLVGLPGESAMVAVLGALAVLIAWSLVPPTYAFALGHVALAAVLPEAAFAQWPTLVWLAVVELGLLGVLLASATSSEYLSDTEESPRGERAEIVAGGIVLGWTLLGGALAWASVRPSLGLPATGGLLVVLTGVAAYGLHRYQLVSLGLAGDGTPAGDTDE